MVQTVLVKTPKGIDAFKGANQYKDGDFVKNNRRTCAGGSRSETRLQLELFNFENAQPNDSSWVFRTRKMGRQAKLRFALGTRLRGCDERGDFQRPQAEAFAKYLFP
ncbi:MAG: hypothetical protein Q4G28_06465 [Neisseria sp.]|nr:hypothetical protein [Neisseria sp.]